MLVFLIRFCFVLSPPLGLGGWLFDTMNEAMRFRCSLLQSVMLQSVIDTLVCCADPTTSLPHSCLTYPVNETKVNPTPETTNMTKEAPPRFPMDIVHNPPVSTGFPSWDGIGHICSLACSASLIQTPSFPTPLVFFPRGWGPDAVT